MSHSVKATLIADQLIHIHGIEINVLDIISAEVDDKGQIVDVYLRCKSGNVREYLEEEHGHWLFRG